MRTLTITLTEAERDAMLRWARMAGVGFTYGPDEPDPNAPDQSAVRKLETAELS